MSDTITTNQFISAGQGTLLLGLVLGMRHATDPDHVLAIGTILSRDPRLPRALHMGLFWGLGHTLTVFAVGALMLIGRVTVPPNAVLAMDLAVAAMLIVLGVVSLKSRAPAAMPSRAQDLLLSPARPFVVGIVHGLAGSAAITLLALSTIGDRGFAFAYLALFGLGTVAGMMLITVLIAFPLKFAGKVSERVPRLIARGSGVLSVMAGLAFAAQSLFAAMR
ncbi:high-affinity nickel-transport family protein [Pendulispora rubella]|uniref:Nickel/cobalt efflux system n=1 Tax=Pendulispora rubella TaxID=2741070 RepID=A0ABZ2KV86_9BACT